VQIKNEKYMEIMLYKYLNKKYLIYILLFILIISLPYIIILIRGDYSLKILISFFISPFTFFIGYWMGLVVIGLQAKSSLFPRKFLKFNCYVFKYFFLIGGLIYSFVNIIAAFSFEIGDFFFNMQAVSFGISLYAHNTLVKYF
jgi:hypothetical protein